MCFIQLKEGNRVTHTPFIAIEGPIGVGKTSLAKAISEHFQFHLLKEIVDENPFLGKFYENIDEWSFQTEMFFLCNRFKQIEELNHDVLQNGQAVVSDYHIMKNLVFAKRSLKPGHYSKYLEIYNILTHDMISPNIVIYLNAHLNTLLNRIKLRGREIEKNISPLYLEQLSKDYDTAMEEFQSKNPHIPVLHFNGDYFDFVQNEHDLMTIMKAIANTLQKEKNHEFTFKI